MTASATLPAITVEHLQKSFRVGESAAYGTLRDVIADGTRRLTHISEITGMEDDVVSMQDVFVFEKQGVSPEGRTLGAFTATGIRPKFAEKLNASGIVLPSNMFEQTTRLWN